MRVTRKEVQAALDSNPDTQLFDIYHNGKLIPSKSGMWQIERNGESVAGPFGSLSEALATAKLQEGDKLMTFESNNKIGRCLYVYRAATRGWVEA